ncbi:hypothetical protein [Sediminicoccus sp. KRV36]|uniref:hypothetical protein n=1 Tax=Sediminicoccus sp. KRV36 TaxID=3133721 RepID=UPI00200F042C|nr:hypothetical protein [Sediminicoccus rosea]UPY37227.1 hypothetical protein LHU95_00605 [Sediminicoccus rosea]
MIQSIRFAAAAPSTAAIITMEDGQEWSTDTSLPPDTWLRELMHDWLAGQAPADYVAPVVAAPRILTVLQFRDRLTPAEEVAITQAGMASAAVRVWLDRLSGAQEVNLDDPRTVAGLHAMAAAGLLTIERVTEILA